MKRYACFYRESGPYGVVEESETLEVYIVHADDSEHAVEQFEDANPDAELAFLTVEVRVPRK